MTETIFRLLTSALGIWEHKEKTKYIDEMIRLQRDYYEEFNKEIYDDSILDNIDFRLRTLCEAFNSAVSFENSKN